MSLRASCDVGISVGVDPDSGKPYVEVIYDGQLKVRYEVRAAMMFGALLLQAAGVSAATHAAYEVLSDPMREAPTDPIDTIHEINRRRLENEENGRI